MSNTETRPPVVDCWRRRPRSRPRPGHRAQGRAARRRGRAARPADAAVAASFLRRRVVLRRPLRPRTGRLHGRAAAPAHRPADRELAVRGRDRAPRLRRRARDGAAGRGEPDDLRPRDRALRGVDPGSATCCTACSCGWCCRDASKDLVREFQHHVPDAVDADGRPRAGADRLSRRRRVAGPHRDPAAGRRGRPRAGRHLGSGGRPRLRARRPGRHRPRRLRRRPARPHASSASATPGSTTCGSPTRPTRRPASCCSAASRSTRAS